MSRLFSLLALITLMLLVLHLPLESGATLSLSLGFLMLGGFLLGKLARLAGLPGITGYLFAGIIFGPYAAGFLDSRAVEGLSPINSFALGLIALTAGGEVDLRKVRERLASYAMITGGQVLVTLAGTGTVMFLTARWFGPGLSTADCLVFGLLFGVSSLTTSPAATVAVIVESGARGRLSELALGITILKDILVVVCFAIGLAAGVQLLGLEGAGDGGLALKLAREIGGSAAAGVLLAGVVLLWMRHVRTELPLFIIAVSFLTSELAAHLHLHTLLICMCAGLLINNLSNRGREFVEAIERGALPIYVVFFAIAGARINLGRLAAGWELAAALVMSRTLFVWLGATLGARAAGESPAIRNKVWMGLLSQSGVALSLAVIVAATFPDWGPLYRDVLIGSIAVFETAGPVLFKLALSRNGETAEARGAAG